jgi:hypothetical protein
MFHFLRRIPSQISPRSILESGIGRMVSHRDGHLAEMNRLENVINAAQAAYNQHTRLYEALNNSLFAVNHPFDPIAAELAAALDADIESLSVDQPSDEERQAAALASLPPRLAASLPTLDVHDAPGTPDYPVIPMRSRRRGNTLPITEQAQ